MDSILPEFIPENELERAFAQARRWNADRAWRRASASLAAGQWSLGAAFLLRLANIYVYSDDSDRLLEIMISICDHMYLLTASEQRSICRISVGFVEALLDADKELGDSRVAIILTAMIKLTVGMKNRDLAYVDMLGYLRRIYGKNLNPEDFDSVLRVLSQSLPIHLDRPVPDSGVPLRPENSAASLRQNRHIQAVPNPRQKFLAIVRNQRFSDPSRYVALLSAFSMEACNGNAMSKEYRELDALLAFYIESGDDLSRTVGEMLWLLTETDLRQIPYFLERLAVVSRQKASSVYLVHRLVFHIKRLSIVSPGSLKTAALVKEALDSINGLRGQKPEDNEPIVTHANKEFDDLIDLRQIDSLMADFSWDKAEELTRLMLDVPNISREQTYRLQIRAARIRVGLSDTFRGAFILDKLYADLKLQCVSS